MPKNKFRIQTKRYIQHQRSAIADIPVITTGNLGISIYEKCGSSNLIKFFTEDYEREMYPEDKLLTDEDLNKFQKIEVVQYNNKKPLSNIIIVTRNEYDRWCAGVTQDIDEEADLCDMTVGDIVDNVISAFGNTPEYINRFMRGHSHLGNKMWYKGIVTLTNNAAVHFIDIKDLSDRRFWNWVCAQDSKWPDVNFWWDKWISEYGEYDIMHNNKLVTEWIRFLLHNHEDLDVIKNQLGTNQQVIDDLKSTDRWLNFGQADQ